VDVPKKIDSLRTCELPLLAAIGPLRRTDPGFANTVMALALVVLAGDTDQARKHLALAVGSCTGGGTVCHGASASERAVERGGK